MRYFIEFAYKGTNYHGWQSQPNAVTVQETLEKALSLLLRQPIELTGAGRTDSGVHASQMFAHFDSEIPLDIPVLIKKLNSFLPKDIAVFNFHPVHDEAHARFDAVLRTYNYHIHIRKNAFECHDSWYFQHELNLEKMNSACAILFEYTDFECFSKTHTDVYTFICKITEAFWTQNGDTIVFTITADRFLRNMVRAIVGTMINIGLGKTEVNDLHRIIATKNRSEAGFSVPAHGLYLSKVEYPYLSQ